MRIFSPDPLAQSNALRCLVPSPDHHCCSYWWCKGGVVACSCDAESPQMVSLQVHSSIGFHFLRTGIYKEKMCVCAVWGPEGNFCSSSFPVQLLSFPALPEAVGGTGFARLGAQEICQEGLCSRPYERWWVTSWLFPIIIVC